ncbi:MAG: phosphoribosylformylglycinamidine cyclo-ligase [bacterium]|nr:phosphoribosylformylglycinamidine cyclo-ligase [candidate division KSB1 bacterium]MDH7560178.1 phosphoribosylformylglycinamidine cyclo-ligase [bacterium]
MNEHSGLTYEGAGVSIATGDESVERIKALAKSTFSSAVLREIGLFGGFYELDATRFRRPVLVSSIDGVGTKLKIACALGVYDTVGEELVNHCVNDVMTSGADPLFFLDYLATGKLRSEVVEQVVAGMARACRQAGCALIGGETAEMPGFYQPDDFDLAGAIVGVVEKDAIVDGRGIQVGDLLIGIASNGLHTNGYSLARKVLLDVARMGLTDHVDELGTTLGEELLRVHRSYQPLVQRVRAVEGLRGIAHITGGGIVGNTRRLLPAGRSLRMDWQAWEVPPIFRLIQRLGNVAEEEMRRVFNLGIGEVLIVAPQAAQACVDAATELGLASFHIGEVA